MADNDMEGIEVYNDIFQKVENPGQDEPAGDDTSLAPPNDQDLAPQTSSTPPNTASPPYDQPLSPPNLEPASAPPAPPPFPEPQPISQKPLNELTLADLVEAAEKIGAQQPAPQEYAAPEDEEYEEEVVYEVDKQAIENDVLQTVKQNMPDLDEAQQVGLARTMAATIAHTLENQAQFMQQLEDIKTLKEELLEQVKPIQQSYEQQQFETQANQARARMASLYPDFYQRESVMEEYYQRYRDKLNSLYDFDRLPLQGKASLLYHLTTPLVQQSGSVYPPQAPAAPPAAPQTNIIPPQRPVSTAKANDMGLASAPAPMGKAQKSVGQQVIEDVIRLMSEG